MPATKKGPETSQVLRTFPELPLSILIFVFINTFSLFDFVDHSVYTY